MYVSMYACMYVCMYASTVMGCFMDMMETCVYIYIYTYIYMCNLKHPPKIAVWGCAWMCIFGYELHQGIRAPNV